MSASCLHPSPESCRSESPLRANMGRTGQGDIMEKEPVGEPSPLKLEVQKEQLFGRLGRILRIATVAGTQTKGTPI